MKLHRHLVVGTLNIVQEIFSGTYADKAIEKSFKAHKQWGARDRHFVAESVYESVRWWSKIWYGLGISEDECLKEGFFKADSQNAWHMMAALLEMQDEPLPDWPEFGGYKSIKPALAKLDKKSALNFAFPTWLFQMGLDELGQAWYPIAEKLNQ
jgi:16S rRNA (cytosine967-C5)-methyltransferase